jgi:hypothetical protein
MKRISILGAGACAAVMGMGAYAAEPAGPPAPIANYWMDVATQSGLGAGMTAGQRPNFSQVMAMMNGGGGGVMHTLDLRLASKDRPAGAPQADHYIPAGLQMGASLPLVTPTVEKVESTPTESMPRDFQRPKGRMLIYWGCGEHVAAGEPMVIDFSKVAAGQVPPGMAAMASMARAVTGPTGAPGFGRWPNERDSRAVPAAGSLIGAHKVQANYAPPIAFSLAASQDFMPGLGLREAGAMPSGASLLQWQPAAQATGYALAMFGSNGGGDVVMWTSASKAQMPAMDYLSPGEVKRLVAAGAVLPPSTSQCTLPAEVAAASPAGMLTMIGYGPEADFADSPRLPKWTTKVRFKTTASLIRGMGAMMGAGGGAEGQEAQQQPQQQQQQQPPKKRRGFGLGDLIGGAVPIPH